MYSSHCEWKQHIEDVGGSIGPREHQRKNPALLHTDKTSNFWQHCQPPEHPLLSISRHIPTKALQSKSTSNPRGFCNAGSAKQMHDASYFVAASTTSLSARYCSGTFSKTFFLGHACENWDQTSVQVRKFHAVDTETNKKYKYTICINLQITRHNRTPILKFDKIWINLEHQSGSPCEFVPKTEPGDHLQQWHKGPSD